MANPSCTVIIVTHNSQKFMPKLMGDLAKQTVPPEKILLVDSGSDNHTYLLPYAKEPQIEIIFAGSDIGFCRGNNVGMEKVAPDCSYVLFLNPDAFLPSFFIEKALAYMEKPENSQVGMTTGVLIGYDIQNERPSGKFDSAGIENKWYGKWYDRAQGEPYNPKRFTQIETLQAICGALMFCRKKALDSVLIRGKEVFDNTFYMYKEDIDLSLRLRKKGWLLTLNPELNAFHCRGWNPNRKQMPRKFRLCSAKNELRIHARQFSPKVLYSLLKYSAVKLFDV